MENEAGLRQRAIAELKRWQQFDDAEMAHMSADGVLTDLLIALGYNDVVAEWEEVRKWYA